MNLALGVLATAAVALALALSGCGASDDQSPQASTAEQPQANGGFPGAGDPSIPNVTTTAGKPEATAPGKAGGGSGSTCIGC
jgi:hypothetical protein